MGMSGFWRGLGAGVGVSLAAAGCSGKAEFDGGAAMADLTKQVSFGPRIPGTPEHDACRDWIEAQMKPLSDSVQLQHFTYRRTVNPVAYRQRFNLPAGQRVPTSSTFPMDNIVATIKGADGKPPQFVLCAHWDTRPTADQETDPQNKIKPIPGADDGASEVAVLIELARVFHANKPAQGVIMVFFDGEDLGPEEKDMYVGAKYYAKHPLPSKPTEGILLDMIGDSDLNIYEETYSIGADKTLSDNLFDTAAKLGHGKNFIEQQKYSVDDDHVPLIMAGIPTVDLIDMDYPSWHTLQDTPDKCSATSLKAVGDTVAAVLYARK